MTRFLRHAHNTFKISGFLVFSVFIMAGCAQTASLQGTSASQPTGGTATAPQAAATVFPDIPIPAGAEMIVDKTLVVGTDNWFGQLALDVAQTAPSVFDFYRARLPEYGWQEITSVRAPVSVLTYDRDNRILQMQIQGSRLRGAEVTITVSPRGTPPSPR